MGCAAPSEMKDSEKFPRLLFSAAAILLAVTLAFTYLVGLYVVHSSEKMTRHRATVQHLSELASTLKDAETGQRGFLLTGQTNYLEPYHEAVRRLGFEEQKLRDLAQEGALPLADIDKLERNIEAKMSELERTIQLRTTNTAAAINTVVAGEGKFHMDQIRSRIRMLINREELEYDRLAQKSALANLARTATFVFTGGVNLAFLAWVYRRLTIEMKARRTASERLQNMIDSISDGLMVLDRAWRITYLSKQGARILHVGGLNLEGKNLWDTVAQGREKKMCPEFTDAMEKRVPRHLEQHYAMHDQWLEIHCYPSHEGLTVYFHDITTRKKAEEVLARSREELEQLVAERTAKLQELVGELEHFSYTITHDMRSPLRAMTGFAEVLEELGPTCPAEQRQHFLSRISAAARRMDLLISDALNYNRAVREELPQEPVDLGALLRGMLDTYPEFQPSKASVEIIGDMPWVLGNEAGLTQCFSNLLGNAVKFVQPGQQPHVTIRAEDRDGWARIWVEDNGIGIASQDLPKIFDMFTRVHTKYEGTGIGLALVRKVVARMGGRLGVESEFGKGTRFWMEFKRVKPPQNPSKVYAPHMIARQTD